MTSSGWIKSKIHEEWEASLPDRFDAERAKQDADSDGIIRDYENSYDMHHKTVEASAEEVQELLARYKKADAGLIRWDEENQRLYEVAEEGRPEP
ncbi:MAG: hypothetical protein H0W55_07350 [Actinobacteria bacterium]|nr:hypothetical protein [Actinomycetota bacterium]MDQ3531238.1 hypothetical protein [Actinomycetota bacterium]